MKRFYKLLLIVSLISVYSCENYLDKFPLDKPSNATFYSNKDEILMAVNACYNYVGSRVEWPWISTQWSLELVTDIAANRNGASYFVQFKKGEMTSNSFLPGSEWSFFYAGVNRTNSLIEGMVKAEAVTDPILYKRIKSEARVIRALCYINLINEFGDVPLITKFIDVNEALTIAKTPKNNILQFIYKELDEAAPDLPTKYTKTEEKGRITRGAAYAMKARIALYNKDYSIAKQAAKAVMDLNVYKLYSSYRDLFTKKGEYSDEIILDIQFMLKERENNIHYFNAPRNSGGQSQSFPTEDLIASFECTDGLSINESPLYDPTNPFVNRDPRIFGAIILPRVWDGTTIKTYGTVFNGIEFMSSKEILYAADGKTVLSSCLSQKEKTVLDTKTNKSVTNQEVTNAFSSRTGYCTYKYMEEANVLTPNNCYTNFILCRYPEVLLIYAEASVELNQIDQTVLDAINMTRARAYGNTTLGGITNIDAINYPRVITTDQAQLRKIIRRERKVELCFEGFRMDDLKRWGILVKALNQRKNFGRPDNYTKLALTDKPVIDADGLVTFPYAESKYGLTNEATKLRYYEVFGTIPSAYNLFPIPLGEIQLNPALVQNSGYN